MKFNLNVEDLKTAIGATHFAVSSRESEQPQYKCLKFSIGAGMMAVMSGDTNHFAETQMEVSEDIKECEFLLNYKKFNHILDCNIGNTLEFEVEENRVVLSSNNKTWVLESLDAESFMLPDDKDKKKVIEVDTSAFLDCLEKLSYALPENTITYRIEDVKLDGKYICSSDGKSASFIKFPLELDEPFYIPLIVIPTLIKFLKYTGGGSCNVFENEHFVVFAGKSLYSYRKKDQVVFPEAINKKLKESESFKNVILFNRQDFSDSVKAIMVNADNLVCEFMPISDNTINLIGKDMAGNSATAILSTQSKISKSFNFLLNCKYLLDICSILRNDIKMSFVSEKEPVRFEGDDYICIIAPMSNVR